VTDGPSRIVDFGAGTITEDRPDEQVDATVTTSEDSLAQFVRAEIEPRYAVMYGRFAIDGPVPLVVRCFEAVWERIRERVPEYHPIDGLAITDDPAEAVAYLREHGYAVLTDLVPDELFKRLYARVVEQAAAEASAGVAYFDDNVVRGGASQRIWCLHNKGAVCREFMRSPRLHLVIDEMLGPEYQLSEFQASFIAAGSPVQVLHTDQIWAQTLLPVALGVNTIFTLDPFTADNGATRVIPGSHIHERGMNPYDIFGETEPTIPAVAPPNSAVMIDSRVWHGAGANTTDEPRRSIIIDFKRSCVRTQTNGPLSVRPEILEEFSDFEKSLYGFKCTADLVNKLENTLDGIFERAPERLIGELSQN
jgi:ectoine hydroxylase-related dioxygenase (phytanoyl-CoA dioxygenase family)